MLTMDAIEKKVRADVFSRLLPTAGRPGLNRDDDLLEVLDSLLVLRMTVQVESTFRIRIENSELTADNIGTLGRLAAFIRGKMDRPAGVS